MDETNQFIQNRQPVNNLQPDVAPQGMPQEAPKQDGMDISKTTIAILVLLTLMISVIGTWTVLNEISTVRGPTQEKSSTSQGTVQLGIISNVQKPVQKQVELTTGEVVLSIQH